MKKRYKTLSTLINPKKPQIELPENLIKPAVEKVKRNKRTTTIHSSAAVTRLKTQNKAFVGLKKGKSKLIKTAVQKPVEIKSEVVDQMTKEQYFRVRRADRDDRFRTRLEELNMDLEKSYEFLAIFNSWDDERAKKFVKAFGLEHQYYDSDSKYTGQCDCPVDLNTLVMEAQRW